MPAWQCMHTVAALELAWTRNRLRTARDSEVEGSEVPGSQGQAAVAGRDQEKAVFVVLGGQRSPHPHRMMRVSNQWSRVAQLFRSPFIFPIGLGVLGINYAEGFAHRQGSRRAVQQSPDRGRGLEGEPKRALGPSVGADHVRVKRLKTPLVWVDRVCVCVWMMCVWMTQ